MTNRQTGFTLVELAISFLIIALLLGGALMTLSAQSAVREMANTQKTLAQARDALMGFAIQYGRLPCPSAPGLTSAQESFTSNPVCSNNFNGYLPGSLLGLSPVDANGYLLDAWGNRIRYAVSKYAKSAVNAAKCPPNVVAPATPDFDHCPAFTTSLAVASIGVNNMPSTTGANALLKICDSIACNPPFQIAVAAIWSQGKNLATSPAGGSSAEEQENADNDFTLISHELRPANSATGEFDDIVLGISPYTFYNRIISAGAL